MTCAVVPDVKSIPRFSPRPPMASAPTSRITPESVKKNFEFPMKSKVILRLGLPAPSADGRAISFVSPAVIMIAWVASTAVNSDTIVPIPSMKAKPCTDWVESTNRMNATMIVTTLASMIADRPFL